MLFFPQRYFLLIQSGREILCWAQLIWLLSAFLALQFINLVVWKNKTKKKKHAASKIVFAAHTKRGKNSNSYYLLPKHICQCEIRLHPGRRAGRELGVGAAPGACWGCKPRQSVSILPCAGTAVFCRASVVRVSNLRFAVSKWWWNLVLLSWVGPAVGTGHYWEGQVAQCCPPMGHHWSWGDNKHTPCLPLPTLMCGTHYTALNGSFSVCDISLVISPRFIGLA